MVLALLLAQGLQICIHAAGGVVSDNPGAPTSAADLESILTVLGDLPERETDTDVPLPAILKNFQIGLALLFVAVLLHVLFVPRRLLLAEWPPETPPRIPSGYDLRPPLRAPPR